MSYLQILALLLFLLLSLILQLDFFQIKVAKNVFSQQIAMVFGLWTIFAGPSLIPWGTTIYGLHAVSRIFPFILLYLLHQKKDSFKHHLICGVFIGLAFWFSYSNMVLIPILFLYRIINREKINKWIYSVLSLSLILITHFLVKTIYFIIPTILLFLIIYIFSPFFDSDYTGNYIKFGLTDKN